MTDSWSKGCELESWQEWWENFLPQGKLSVLTLIWYPFYPMLPQWHIKDPSHSAKSAGGRLHLNMLTSLIQRSQSGLIMLSRHSVGIFQRNELTRNSLGNIRPQSAHWFWPKMWDWCAWADLHLYIKKKSKWGGGGGDKLPNVPKIITSKEKPTTTTNTYLLPPPLQWVPQHVHNCGTKNSGLGCSRICSCCFSHLKY